MALIDKILFLLFSLFLPTLNALLNQASYSSDAAKAFEASLIQQACLNTFNHEDCASRLRIEFERDGRGGDGGGSPLSVLHAAVRGTIGEAVRAIETISGLSALSSNPREEMAIHDCVELVGYSVDELTWSLAEMGTAMSGGSSSSMHSGGNLRAWLSAALSNQDTCLEGFEGTDGRLKDHVKGSLDQVTQLVGNLLMMFRRLASIIPHDPPRNGSGNDRNVELPPWIEASEEGLMRSDRSTMHFDAVVALDGSGTAKSINQAVDRAPSHSSKRYVILVKKGEYKENVELKRKKSNIMLVGEGMGVTVITGSRSFMQGWTTFRTATFAVSGQGFIARDITFRNTADPKSHQAVALRVDSDRSVFFRCSIEGYQDTLYAHSLRQFYRDCNIYGTIDFIFGNGLIVIQHSSIYTRRPLPFQKVTITAQGRKDPNQNTGFSIHNSLVHATYPTYLGRPWKAYSRTVFMQSYLSLQVQPRGWLEWAGNFALNTLYYGEYMNYGPGASLSGRVRWPGYHVIRDASTASFFTVRRFIDGLTWLPGTGVPYTSDLIK